MTARPRIHFTPARNWMNDPNGLVFHRGLYHLFFQYNPCGTDHGNMSWGHATSPDLMEWTEHPVAIRCDEDEEIFSGSIVVDEEDTSGFGSAALVAVYTSHSPDRQTQSLAYSLDDGMTWTKHAGNPVLDRGSRDFRDPKVFRYAGPAGEYWVMVAVEAVQRQVVLYRSDDLRTWSFLSAYGPAGAVDGVWECPDLFPLALDGDTGDVRWVLVISLSPGGIAGGSGTQYVVGRFDGVTFTPERPASDDAERVDWLDHGRDCYAGVTFNGLPDDERVLIAWMSNWQYARTTPTAPWRGAMTVPRRLTLITVDGRPQLRAQPILPIGRPIDSTLPLPASARIGVRAELRDAASVVVAIVGDEGRVVVEWTSSVVRVDRTDAGAFDRAFPGTEAVTLAGGGAELDIILDTCSIEVFADSGTRTITDLAFLGASRRIELSGSAVVDALVVTDLGGGA